MTIRPDLDREAQIGESGLVAPEDLDAIGERSALTCPSCNGALWKLYDERPLRFRCHTGHAFSADSLEEANAQSVEDAIWSAIRAIHERIIFATERRRWAQRVGSEDQVAIEQARIDENRRLAELLRNALGAAAVELEPEHARAPK